MAEDWCVLAVGDSWMSYSHACWGEILARRLGTQFVSASVPGVVSSMLPAQTQHAVALAPKAPGGLLRRKTVVVIHTGGNDFMRKIADAAMGLFMGGGRTPNLDIFKPMPGAQETEHIKNCIELFYRAGARYFLVSGPPLYAKMPVCGLVAPFLTGFVNSGMLSEIGVGPGDPPLLALEVQAISINERMSDMMTAFGRDHPDAHAVFFDECEALDNVRSRMGEAAFATQMFDFTMIHPTPLGHMHLAEEAHQCLAESVPEILALVSPPRPVSGTVPNPPSTAETTDVATQASVATQEPVEVETISLSNEMDKKEEDEKPTNEIVHAVEASRCITVNVRNVKGDLQFQVSCDANSNVGQFRQAVIAAGAPLGPHVACTLAFKGKFLVDDVASLVNCGVEDGTQVIAVMKPATNSSPSKN